MSASDIEGKTVLIVGASRGIGAAAAAAFARAGARLALAARDVAAMEELAGGFPSGTETLCLRTDLAVPGDIERCVEATLERYGRLDVACNNAGMSQKRVPFAETSDEVFDAVMNVNLRGLFIAMKLEIRAMIRGGGGAIVNTGSIGSNFAMPQMAAYVASKHALLGLTRTAAFDHAAQNVRVNLIAAGPVDTPMFRRGIGATPEGQQRVAAATPLGRVSSADEIAAAILWLASPASSYVTGALLPVDGGYTLT